MNDDERPRSSSALTQGAIRTDSPDDARGSVTALFIILTGLLVLVNAFFVIAEYSLVRSRKSRLQEMAEEGKRGRAPGARRSWRTSATTSPPARSGSRWPRSASVRSASRRSRTCSSRCSAARSGTRAAIVVSVIISYLLITVAQSIVGEIAPKLYTIQHAEDLARRIARPLHIFRVLFTPVHLCAQLGVQLAAAADRHRPRRRARGRHARRDQADHRRVLAAAAASTWARPTCSPASFTCTSRRPGR